MDVEHRFDIWKSIYSIYMTRCVDDVERAINSVLTGWDEMGNDSVTTFKKYFQKQWLPKVLPSGQYDFTEDQKRPWKWQLFHLPPGYAKTNNPAEITNRKIHQKASRKMKLLKDAITDLQGVVKTESQNTKPVFQPSGCVASKKMIREAQRLKRAKILVAAPQPGTDFYLVRHNTVAEARALLSAEIMNDLDHQVLNDIEIEHGEEEEAFNAIEISVEDTFLYSHYVTTFKASLKKTSSWADRHLQRHGQPLNGWRVDVTRQLCLCFFVLKMVYASTW